MGFVLVGVDGTWTAKAEIPAGRTAVLLEPSLVSVRGPSVTVRVQPAEDVTSGRSRSTGRSTGPTELFLGRGRSDDLTAYAQDPKVIRVVGLDRSRELDVRDGPGPVAALPSSGASTASAGSAASSPTAQSRPPTAVDLWQQQVSGPDARTLTWRPTSGAQSVLIAAEDATPLPALDIEVAWTDHSWLWIPAVVLVLGIALIAAGLLLGGRPAWAVQLRLPPGGLRLHGARQGAKDEPAAGAPSQAPARPSHRRPTGPTPDPTAPSPARPACPRHGPRRVHRRGAHHPSGRARTSPQEIGVGAGAVAGAGRRPRGVGAARARRGQGDPDLPAREADRS